MELRSILFSFFAIMPPSGSLQVTSQGSQTTIALLQDHLNHVGAGLWISTHLEDLAAIEPCPQNSLRLNLDLRQVDRITSAGLNELIGINSLARSRGIRLVLLDVQESVREIFALTRLERMFEFHCSGTGV